MVRRSQFHAIRTLARLHGRVILWAVGHRRGRFRPVPEISPPRKLDEFRNVIEDSFRDDSTFMNAVMIAKFYENGSIVLRNLTLIRTDRNIVTTQSIRRDEISAVVEKYFGMPRQIAEEAVNELLELKDTWD